MGKHDALTDRGQARMERQLRIANLLLEAADRLKNPERSPVLMELADRLVERTASDVAQWVEWGSTNPDGELALKNLRQGGDPS